MEERFRLHAEVYRLGLISGFFTKDEVIEWADEVIAKERQPEQAIIELSLGQSSNTSNFTVLLRVVSGQRDTATAFHTLMGLYAKRLRKDTLAGLAIARRLRQLSSAEDLYESGTLSWLEDIYILASNNVYGTTEEATKELQSFLEEYEPLADEFLKITNDQRRSAYGT